MARVRNPVSLKTMGYVIVKFRLKLLVYCYEDAKSKASYKKKHPNIDLFPFLEDESMTIMAGSMLGGRLALHLTALEQ